MCCCCCCCGGGGFFLFFFFGFSFFLILSSRSSRFWNFLWSLNFICFAPGSKLAAFFLENELEFRKKMHYLGVPQEELCSLLQQVGCG